MGLVPGEVLAGTSYQVVREIGAGGMGVVYEVEHVRLRKRYVAKVIHDSIRGDATAPMRMEREAHVLAEINHPNVVQVHDVGTTPDGVSYFVMEKLEGNDLRHAMTSGALSTALAVGICADILEALDHVHRRGIVHRDIKPENVFLARTPTGVATKVLDFGIVHIFDKEHTSQARITKTGGFVGTLYYAAPEQMQGSPAGPANDVYACGLVLYEMLAGRGPFDDDPGVGLSRCFKPAPRLPETEQVSAALADVVAAALEQTPERRPTAGVLAAKLRELFPQTSTDPGTGVREQVDRLLVNMNLHTAKPGVSLALSAPPPTPLMAGAPPRTAEEASGPPSPRTTKEASAAGRPPSPAAIAYAATLGSAGADAPAGPIVDTSSGVSSTLDPPVLPKPSRAVMIGAPLAAVAVLGLLATAGITALRGHAASSLSASSAVSESPPIESALPEPTSSTTLAADAPELASSTTLAADAPEPASSDDLMPASSATLTSDEPEPAGSDAKPAVAVPGHPAKPRGNAEKSGYFHDL